MRYLYLFYNLYQCNVPIARDIINSDAKDTTSLCTFFDNLFDSLNGSFDKIVDGKKYRTAVKKNSPHHELWANSLKVLSTMSFVDQSGKKISTPTIQNLLIKGFVIQINYSTNNNKKLFFQLFKLCTK